MLAPHPNAYGSYASMHIPRKSLPFTSALHAWREAGKVADIDLRFETISVSHKCWLCGFSGCPGVWTTKVHMIQRLEVMGLGTLTLIGFYLIYPTNNSCCDINQ